MISAPPLTLAQLEGRVAEVAVELGVAPGRVRSVLSAMITSQMLPDAVAVKGGMGIKLRLGESGTRATTDLDVSTPDRGLSFEEEFGARLAQGWGRVPASKGSLKKDPQAPARTAFTASLKAKRRHDPGLRAPAYVMHPYRVSIAFLGKAFSAIDVEVAHPEIDAHAHAPRAVDPQLVWLSDRFGFGPLMPVELVDLEYQIAQKVHALVDEAYRRAHDLVDLQLLMAVGPDMAVVRDYCRQTFAFRRQPAWPPLPLRAMDGWEDAYAAAALEANGEEGHTVVRTLSQARTWFDAVLHDLAGYSR